MNELVKARLKDVMTEEQWERSNFGSMKSRGKKQSPSNALTDAVINYVRLNGGAARRVNTQGTYVEAKYNERGVQLKGTGAYRKSGMKRGFEDVSCIIPPHGKYLAVEVKIGADKLRDEQIERKAEVEKCGGLYFVAKDFDSFKLFYDNLQCRN